MSAKNHGGSLVQVYISVYNCPQILVIVSWIEHCLAWVDWTNWTGWQLFCCSSTVSSVKLSLGANIFLLAIAIEWVYDNGVLNEVRGMLYECEWANITAWPILLLIRSWSDHRRIYIYGQRYSSATIEFMSNSGSVTRRNSIIYMYRGIASLRSVRQCKTSVTEHTEPEKRFCLQNLPLAWYNHRFYRLRKRDWKRITWGHSNKTFSCNRLRVAHEWPIFLPSSSPVDCVYCSVMAYTCAAWAKVSLV